jgi:hypothetical protein
MKNKNYREYPRLQIYKSEKNVMIIKKKLFPIRALKLWYALKII